MPEVAAGSLRAMLSSQRATLGGTGRATSGGRPFLLSAISNSACSGRATAPALGPQIIPLVNITIFMAFFCHSFYGGGGDGERCKPVEIRADHLVAQCPDRVVPRPPGRNR